MTLTVRRAALTCALLPLLAALGACSSGAGYDGDAIAQKIHDEQVKKTPDLDVSDATCPEEAEPAKGEVVECTIEIEGVEAPYSITFKSGDGGAYTITPAKAIITTVPVVEALKKDAADQDLGEVEVDCGETILVQEVDSTFVCTMSQGQATQDVTMVVDDLDGTVSPQG